MKPVDLIASQGDPHKATTTRGSSGKGLSGSRYKNCIAFSWALSSFLDFGLNWAFHIGDSCGFHDGECEAQLKQRCKRL